METETKRIGGNDMPIYDLGKVVGPQGPKGDKGDTGDAQDCTLVTNWDDAVITGYYYSVNFEDLNHPPMGDSYYSGSVIAFGEHVRQTVCGLITNQYMTRFKNGSEKWSSWEYVSPSEAKEIAFESNTDILSATVQSAIQEIYDKKVDAKAILVSDWNDAIKPGFYYSANNAANAPTFEGAAGGTGLYGLVFCCGKQVRQVVMPGFGSGCKVRFCNAYDSNTWYMWQDPLPLANASMSINGLMSYADKAKLDNTYTKEDSRQTFANAFVGEKSGTVVSLPDVAESTLLRKVAVQGATTEVLANPDAEKSPDNIATINGTEPTALTMCGKNLLPYKYESDTQTNLGITATRNPDGSITIQGMNDGTAPSSIYLARNNLGLHLPAGTYTLSAGTLPRGIDLYITPGYKFGTFTLQEAADFTIAYFNISLNTDLSAGITVYPQLEVGSTATSYEPYSGTDYPLPALEPLMSLPNGVRDEYDAVTGVETRRIGKLALNGTENWNILSGQCNETSSFFYLVFPMGGGIVDCTHLICRTIVSGSETYTYDGIYGNAVGSTLYIRLNHSHNITTAEGLKEWLAAQHAAGTPVTVYYELAEPVITQHTPTAIPAVYPTTTVYSDQGDISVTYNCDSNQIYGELVDGLEGKVDKETGKGLSANDYTTAEKQKLAGIAQNANNYTHPTTSGNKHIPSGGEEKQILRFDSDGTAKWDNEIDAYPKEEIDHKMDAVNAMMVQILIKCYGVKEAMRRFVSAYADGGEDLSPIVGQFFEAAASTIGETYTSQFPKYSAGTSTEGIKLDDNAGLVCTPSTIAAAGQDDYADLPLFACFDVNYTIDGTSLEPVILAIKDIYGGFTKAPANSFVGVMQMTGWVRRTSTDTTKKVEYRATEETGFKPLPEAVRVDGTVRGFVIHAKYAAGFNSAWLLSSVSGVQPASLRTGSAGSTSISHNGQIAKWREWGDQYCGSSLCDIAFVQLMLEIKYAVLGSAQIMTGCRSYSASYQAAVAETGVTRILLTAANAAYFIIGSCVSLGSTNDRAKATAYDVCDITKILTIEDVMVDGTAYKAINLDTETPFNTTVETYITPQPWRTGSTDDVPGNDGSPYSNTNSKEPCKIQGIEIMLGLYEVLADVSLNQDTEKYTVYANRKASEIASDGSGANPAILGTITKDATANWDYVAELNWDENSPESYMLGKTFGASPSTGYRAGVYRDGVSTTGWREWMVAGYLNYGSISGFACAHLINDPSYSYWNISARACGSGGNRGEANHTV